MSRAHIVDMILIGKTDIYGNVDLLNSTISDVRIVDDVEVLGEIRMDYSTIGKSILISDSTTSKGINLVNVDTEELDIYNSKIAGVIQMPRANISKINISPWDPASKGHGCEILGFDGISSHVTEDVHISDCHIKENINISRAHIGGSFGLVNSKIGEDKIGDEADEPATMIVASSVNVKRDLDLSGSSGWDILDLQEAIVGGNVKLDGAVSWEELWLNGATVGGKLNLDSVQDSEDLQFLNLRNAKMKAVNLGGSECIPGNLIIDFFGWRYDAREMEPFFGQTVECLDELIWTGTAWGSRGIVHLIRKGSVLHLPQPYIYMSERLDELGMNDKADDLRILERKRDLEQRTGWPQAQQWLIGWTTEFGYSPMRALVCFLFLVLVGMIFVFLANWRRPNDRIALNGRKGEAAFWFRGISPLGGIFVILWWMSWLDDVNVLGFGTIGSALWIFALLIVRTSGVALKSAEGPKKKDFALLGVRTPGAAPNTCRRSEKKGSALWRTIHSGFLYSLDRALPFLGFDGEHISWFEKEARLNDNFFLCLYFYIQAVLGFALITLFIAGLTGVLK